MEKPHSTDPLHYHYRSHSPVQTIHFLLDLKTRSYIWLYTIFLLKHSPVWLFPIVTAYLIDTLTEPSSERLKILIALGVVYTILIALNVPLQVYFSVTISKDIRRLETRLRNALITRLHQLAFSTLDETKSGKLSAKILRDVEQVQFMCFHMGQFIPMACLNLLVAIAYTTWVQPLMLGFFVLQVPLSIILIHFFRGTMKTRNEAYRMEVENMNADVSESIDMIPVTRAHGVEAKAERDLGQKFVSVEQKGVRLDQFNALFGASTWVTFQVSMLNAIIVAALLAWNGYISVGEVVLFQGFFGMIIHSVESILGSYPIATRGVESLKSIGEVIECPDIEYNEGKDTVDSVEGAVEFEDVDFAYTPKSDPALKNFTLKVEPGECIALVGHSGSGKSTLMSLLIGFRRPTRGRIILDGRDMESIDMRSWRRFISLVPQRPLLISGTIRENIAYGLDDISDQKIYESLENASLIEFVESLPDGINTRLHEGGESLSGGQRQRIAIARAFVRNPSIIIFDEATSALDVSTERLVQEAISRLARGRTTFIIAHRLSTIRDANRIVVLDKGRIIETGSPADLLAQRGAFYEMSQLQS